MPRNLNYLWTFGAILSFMLGAQIVTGVILAMHYVPSATEAFASIEHIMRDVNYGWLIRYLHTNGASMFFLAVYMHMFRGIYYGSYKAPREVLWILGVIIYLLMMATAFMGYVLPWGSMSFAGATVITNLFTAIPLVGTGVAHWLWGGYAVGDPTLNRFFSLHYLLPFMIAGVVGLHIWALHVGGQNNPDGVEVQGRRARHRRLHALCDDQGPVRALACSLILYAWFVFYIPNYLLDADNSVPANPLVTPAAYRAGMVSAAVLRDPARDPQQAGRRRWRWRRRSCCSPSCPGSTPRRSSRAKYRPLFRFFFWMFVVCCVGLGYLGSQEVSDGTTLVARILAIGYFGFLLVVLPLLGLIEKTKPLPASIADAVLQAKRER